MSRVFLFPGQGSQSLGIGKDLYENFNEAKNVFEEVNDALSMDLSGIVFGEDAEKLNLTENAQPALMAVSIAVLKVIESKTGKKINELADMVAGHSLGEYPALCATGAISLSETARLLKVRGKAMQEAVPSGVGSMMAIIGMEKAVLEDVVAKASSDEEFCSIANDNCPGQIVISGHAGAVAKAGQIALEAGARKAVPLPVSTPAHCKLMMPAKEKVVDILSEIEFKAPSVDFVSNRTAVIENDPEKIKDYLADQMVNGVRFTESVAFMIEKGATDFAELGAGKVLSGLVKRSSKEVTSVSVNNTETLEEFLKTL